MLPSLLRYHIIMLQDEVLCLEGEVVMTCREFLKFVANTYPESKGECESSFLSKALFKFSF